MALSLVTNGVVTAASRGSQPRGGESRAAMRASHRCGSASTLGEGSSTGWRRQDVPPHALRFLIQILNQQPLDSITLNRKVLVGI